MVATAKSIFKQATPTAKATPKAATPKPATAGKAAKRVKPKDTTITNPRAMAAAVVEALDITDPGKKAIVTAFFNTENPDEAGRNWGRDIKRITDLKKWQEEAQASGAWPVTSKDLKPKIEIINTKIGINKQLLAILSAIDFLLGENGKQNQTTLGNTISGFVNMSKEARDEEITNLERGSQQCKDHKQSLLGASRFTSTWESGAKSSIAERQDAAKLQKLKENAEKAKKAFEAAQAAVQEAQQALNK